MLKRLSHWLALSFLSAVLVVGCGLGNSSDQNSQSTAADCRVVQHDLGEAQICGQPQKIAVLNAYPLGLLLALDQQPAGYAAPLNVHQGEVFDNPVQQIPYLGERVTTQPINLGASGEPALERLVAFKPDLIVTEGTSNYNLLSQIAPTILWETRGFKGQWQQHLRSLAAALGQGDKAETVIEQYETRVAEARAEFAEVVAAHPKLLLLAAHRLDEGVFVLGADSYLDELLSGIGFELALQPSDNIDINGPVSIEALPRFDDADSIIVLGYDLSGAQGQDSSADQSVNEQVEQQQRQTIQQDWEASGIAQSLAASQAGRVYFATFYKWMGLSGPIGAELVLEQLSQFLLGE